MRALLIVVPAPTLHLLPSIFKAHEPVGIPTFRTEAAVEGLDERIVCRFAGAREVERHALGVSPQIEITRDELAALVDADRCWVAKLSADLLQNLHHVLAR